MLLTGLGIVGIAALLRCPSGPGTFGSCFAGGAAMLDAGITAEATEEDDFSVPALAIKPAAAAPAPMQASQPQTTWSEALIAGTFEQLPAEPGRAAATATPQPEADALATGSIAERPTPAANQQSALADVVAGSPSGAAEPAALVPRPRIDDARRQAAATATAAADETAETRTIGGRGVNVRSGPSKSNGKLFALAPGEEVRVTQRKRGWLQVVDDKGRSGWIYSSFVLKR